MILRSSVDFITGLQTCVPWFWADAAGKVVWPAWEAGTGWVRSPRGAAGPFESLQLSADHWGEDMGLDGAAAGGGGSLPSFFLFLIHQPPCYLVILLSSPADGQKPCSSCYRWDGDPSYCLTRVLVILVSPWRGALPPRQGLFWVFHTE